MAISPRAVKRASNEYRVPPVTPEAAATSWAVTPGRSRTTASTASRLAPRGARVPAALARVRARPLDFAADRAFAADLRFAAGLRDPVALPATAAGEPGDPVLASPSWASTVRPRPAELRLACVAP